MTTRRGRGVRAVAIRTVETLADADRDAIVDGLLRYNAEHGFASAWENLAVVARDRSGALIGGLLGETNLGWLFVAVLWVAESRRGRGVGTALLAAAEKEARRRKCIGVYLDTFDFQARPFYERLGYQLFGTLPNSPPGGMRYYLYKRLGRGRLRVPRKRRR
jgi:GNAT superfamily N-acetyltransferase